MRRITGLPFVFGEEATERGVATENIPQVGRLDPGERGSLGTTTMGGFHFADDGSHQGIGTFKNLNLGIKQHSLALIC